MVTNGEDTTHIRGKVQSDMHDRMERYFRVFKGGQLDISFGKWDNKNGRHVLSARGACPSSESIHADYSSLTDLRPPVKLMREERRRRRGKAGRLGIWLTARETAMPGRLQAILPAAWMEGGGGGRFWGGNWGAGCRSARTRLAHGGGRGGAGCTMVQRRRHGALVHLPVCRKA